MDHLNHQYLSALLNAYQKAINVHFITSVTDHKGIILYVNDKFCEISKYSRAELLGHSHNIINSGHHEREFFIHLWKTIGNGEIWTGEIMNKAKDGRFYWVQTVILPIETGGTIQYLSIRVEITRKKELEKKQEEYIKSLEQLLVINSHKIRKPITNLMGLINLSSDMLSEKEMFTVTEFIRKSITELDDATKDVNFFLHHLKQKHTK